MNEIDLGQAWFALKNELSRYGVMENSVMTKFNVLTKETEPLTVRDVLGMIEEEETYDKEVFNYLLIDWLGIATVTECYGKEKAEKILNSSINHQLSRFVSEVVKDTQNTYKVFTIKEELPYSELSNALRYNPKHMEALREFKPYKVKVVLQIKEDKSN